MKKQLLLFLIVTIFTGYQAISQADALVTNSGAVRLDENQPLKDHYTISASQFNFESDQQAINYFNAINTEFVAYRPTLYNGKVNIYLQLKKQPDWTIEDWNDYLFQNKIIDTSVQPAEETPHQTSN